MLNDWEVSYPHRSIFPFIKSKDGQRRRGCMWIIESWRGAEGRRGEKKGKISVFRPSSVCTPTETINRIRRATRSDRCLLDSASCHCFDERDSPDAWLVPARTVDLVHLLCIYSFSALARMPRPTPKCWYRFTCYVFFLCLGQDATSINQREA